LPRHEGVRFSNKADRNDYWAVHAHVIARRDSLNAGWHNASFRGFADYMQMTESRENLEELINLAKSEQIAIMCAEAVPLRCHRSLIADVLLAHGIEVWEITSATRTQHAHPYALGQDHWKAGHLSC
jgi:hypothetical protein